MVSLLTNRSLGSGYFDARLDTYIESDVHAKMYSVLFLKVPKLCTNTRKICDSVNMMNITTQTVPYPISLYFLLLVRALGENQYCTDALLCSAVNKV